MAQEVRSWRHCPFTVGRSYRVRHDFVAFRDSFKAGEILIFDSDAWSGYHGMLGYFFKQEGRSDLRSWDIPDNEDVGIWTQFFEELPSASS